MQLLGLGAIAAVLPLALWGWRLMKSGDLGRLQLRLALWVIGAGAATALASALPADRELAPADRPRRRGRRRDPGRSQGDPGLSSGAASAVLGFLFAGIAILTLTRRLRPRPGGGTPARGAGGARRSRLPARRRKIQDWDEAEEIGHDEPGWGIVSLGRARPWPHEPARQRPPLEAEGRRQAVR